MSRAFNQLFKSCWSNIKFLIKWNGGKKEISMLPGKSSDPVVGYPISHLWAKLHYLYNLGLQYIHTLIKNLYVRAV